MPESEVPGRSRAVRGACVPASLVLLLGCAPAREAGSAEALVHLAERLAPPGADPGARPLPPPRPGWEFPGDAAAWSSPEGVIGTSDVLEASSSTGRVLLAGPPLDLPLASVHSIDLRFAATPGARVYLTWGDTEGDFERSLADAGDPGAGPVYGPRSARLAGMEATRDYRILARDLWRADAAGASAQGGGDVTVLRDEWKLTVRDYGEHLESGVTLFDLASDPGERNDVAARLPERVESMTGLARGWYVAVRSDGAPGEVEIRPEAMEQLRALGYVE